MKHLILIFLMSALLFAKAIEPPKRIQDTNYKYIAKSGVPTGIVVRGVFVENSGTPTVSNQSGYWVVSIFDNQEGIFTMTLKTGAFSSAPHCVATTGTYGRANLTTTTKTSVQIRNTNSSETFVDDNVYIICIGEI